MRKPRNWMITAPIQLASDGICGHFLSPQSGEAAEILSEGKRYFIKINGIAKEAWNVWNL